MSSSTCLCMKFFLLVPDNTICIDSVFGRWEWNSKCQLWYGILRFNRAQLPFFCTTVVPFINQNCSFKDKSNLKEQEASWKPKLLVQIWESGNFYLHYLQYVIDNSGSIWLFLIFWKITVYLPPENGNDIGFPPFQTRDPTIYLKYMIVAQMMSFLQRAPLSEVFFMQ